MRIDIRRHGRSLSAPGASVKGMRAMAGGLPGGGKIAKVTPIPGRK
jgi:hypothetical protein